MERLTVHGKNTLAELMAVIPACAGMTVETILGMIIACQMPNVQERT